MMYDMAPAEITTFEQQMAPADMFPLVTNLGLKIDQVRANSEGLPIQDTMQDAHLGQLPSAFYGYLQQVPQRVHQFAASQGVNAQISQPLFYNGCVSADWMVRFDGGVAFDELKVRQLMQDWKQFAADMAVELTAAGDLKVSFGTTEPPPTTHAVRAPLRFSCVANANGTLFAARPQLVDDVLLLKVIARFDGSLTAAEAAATTCRHTLETELGASLETAFPGDFVMDVELTSIVPLAIQPGASPDAQTWEQCTLQFDLFIMAASMEADPVTVRRSLAALQVVNDALYFITPFKSPVDKLDTDSAKLADLEAKLAAMTCRVAEMQSLITAAEGQDAEIQKLSEVPTATAASSAEASSVAEAAGAAEAPPPMYSDEDRKRKLTMSHAKLIKYGLPALLLEEPWFNDWSRQQTETYLLGAGAQDGLFAVRQSSTDPDKLVFSVCQGGLISHHKIMVDAGQWLKVEYRAGDLLKVFGEQYFFTPCQGPATRTGSHLY